MDFFTARDAIKAIDANAYLGDGIARYKGCAEPADNGLAKRVSAFYETTTTLCAVHFYRLASGRIDGPYYSDRCVTVPDAGGIRSYRARAAIRAAEPILRALLENGRWTQAS